MENLFLYDNLQPILCGSEQRKIAMIIANIYNGLTPKELETDPTQE